MPEVMDVSQKQRQLALATTLATWDRTAEETMKVYGEALKR